MSESSQDKVSKILEQQKQKNLQLEQNLQNLMNKRLDDAFVDFNRQSDKALGLLHGRTVVNLFFENSTRTSSSFEIAAKRLGADVVGADAAEGNIAVARLHARQQGLAIDYRATTAEAMAGEVFDVVLALEIVEHVADPASFIATCRDLVRPGGLVILSTLNRTARSFGAAIIGAEWIMRWLPRGTHDWSRFITPDELAGMAGGAGLSVLDRRGMVFNPLTFGWSLSDRDLSVNYIMTARRDA